MCLDLGFECVYTPPLMTANVIVQKDYLQGLEERVKRIEESLGSVRGDLDGLTKRVDCGPEEDRNREDVPFNSSVREVQGETRVAAPMPDSLGVGDSVDAMGDVIYADEEDSGFFGKYI
jgi:hypothetical protein